MDKVLIVVFAWIGFAIILTTSFFVYEIVPNSEVSLSLDDEWVSLDHKKLDWYDNDKYSIYYTGFIGCSQSCPMALNKLNELCRVNSNIKGIFLIIDPLVEWEDIQSYMDAFPNIKVYRSTSKEPHNQLRRIKFFMGNQNIETHSDYFLVIPPKNKLEKPFITKDIPFSRYEL